MTETRDLVLADRTFAVPPLPLRHNRVVYPLCRDLSMTQGEDDTESFIGRLVAAGGKPEAVRDDEWPKLEKIALHAAMAADPAFDAATFDAMPITMMQLIDAFFVARQQTGVWLPVSAPADVGRADAESELEVIGPDDAGNVSAETPLP